MRASIFDIESNGLLHEAEQAWCLSYITIDRGRVIDYGTLTDPLEIVEWLETQEILIGHNIVRYDIPLIKLLYGYTVTCDVIDTLALSYYLFPLGDAFRHGLEAWGERFGIPKPEIKPDEWKGPLPHETQEQFIAKMSYRCAEDIKINYEVFLVEWKYIMEIYDNNTKKVWGMIKYLNFKFECLAEQEEVGIHIDINTCIKLKNNLDFSISQKTQMLASVMPPILDKTKPAKCFKNDGKMSVTGAKWFALLDRLELPHDTEETFVEGNPKSPKQLKDFLFAEGWEPVTFKTSASSGEDIPQVNLPFGKGLCPSIHRLIEVNPKIQSLGGLSVDTHRRGIFKGYIDSERDGKVYAGAHGFTNTLRVQHSKPIVNLPGVDKYMGEEIRGVLQVPDKEKYIMIGADISGLEDNTKQHYLYFKDPQYVEDMRVPGFDPHMDIAVLAGLATREEELFFRHFDEESASESDKIKYKAIKKVRSSAKVINFSAVYGAGPAKIAATLGCTLKFAQNLHKTYWERNKAVKQVANSVKTKTLSNGQQWLYNPVSKKWYFLKAEKDKFSTLNQGTGAFVFDSWVREVRKRINPLGIKICLQYHDELLIWTEKENQEIVTQILHESMALVNQKLNLNVEIGISVDPGSNYAECH